MKYIYYDLGQRKRGEMVEIKFSSAANVRLMDSANLLKYKNNTDCRFYGGLVRKSPFLLPIPNSGQWHLVIDTQGLTSATKVSMRILAAP